MITIPITTLGAVETVPHISEQSGHLSKLSMSPCSITVFAYTIHALPSIKCHNYDPITGERSRNRPCLEGCRERFVHPGDPEWDTAVEAQRKLVS
jgi:hypothetical protein